MIGQRLSAAIGLAALALVGAALLPAPAGAAARDPGADGAAAPAAAGEAPLNVFLLPALVERQQRALRLAAAGHEDVALRELDKLIDMAPQLPDLWAARAVLNARAGLIVPAVRDLEEAVSRGFRSLSRVLAAVGGDALLADPGYQALAAHTATLPLPDAAPWEVALPPEPVFLARAEVARLNTFWDATRGVLVSRFAFPRVLERRPVFMGQLGPAARVVQEWYLRGRAAGLAGDLYDNRDRGHSRLATERIPQLTVLDYGPEARAAGIDYGANTGLTFGAVTFGNSSTALTAGPLWRSLPRAMLTRGQAQAVARLYGENMIYVYPEHRDHDPESDGGWGDLMPANTPYFLVSQGSSGSDRPHLRALAHILASFRPKTKRRLREAGLVAPAVQMVFRRGQRSVADDREAYLGPAAHPSVFSADEIDLRQMIMIANRIAPDAIPPMVRLEVVEDFELTPDEAPLGDALGEVLFDTPSAVARIWRSLAPTRRIVLDAGGTVDPNGHALNFTWRLLRGDPEKVRISTGGPGESRAEIEIDWQEGHEVPGHGGEGAAMLASHRVDIAVFADNGRELSAPAFLSVLFPSRQSRIYEETGEAEAGMRLLSVSYDEPELGGFYQDPLLFPERGWSDLYRYDTRGRLMGWTRLAHGAAPETAQEYTRHGFLVRERDALGRPIVAEAVTYPVTPRSDGTSEIVARPSGRLLGYTYVHEIDRRGIVGPADPAQ